MPIKMVKCRASIKLGGITVKTPFVQSFTVNKSRSQFSTFSASLKVAHDDTGGPLTGSEITIHAGEGNGLNPIFAGYVQSAKISPCYEDPAYVILSVSGYDVLNLLQGKSYTRRSRATKSTWVTIDSLVTPGLKSGKFKYVTEPTIETSFDEPPKKPMPIITPDLNSLGETAATDANYDRFVLIHIDKITLATQVTEEA